MTSQEATAPPVDLSVSSKRKSRGYWSEAARDLVGGAEGPKTVVNVVNNAPGTKAVPAAERMDGDMRIIDVVIEQVAAKLAQDIGRGVGPVPGALADTYGLSRAVR